MTSGQESTGLPRGYPFREEWEVTPRMLVEEMERDAEVVLIDCRTAEERSVAHIEGSVLIPMGEMASRQAELEAIAERRVIVHCHRGQRSLRVVTWLRQLGFSDVWSLAGGIDAWSTGVDASVPRY